MRNARSIALFGVGWVIVMGALIGFLAHSQARSRDALNHRFDARAVIASRFVSTYVSDLVIRQRGVARRKLSGARVGEGAFGDTVADSRYEAAVLLDERGRVLRVAPSKPSLLGAPLSRTYPHLAAAVAGQVGVSPVVPSAAQGLPVVAFAVPFDTPQGRRVFSGGYDVFKTPLGAYLRNAIPIAGTRLYLVDSAGVLVAKNGPKPSRPERLAQIDAPLTRASKASAAGFYESGTGRRRFATRAVAGTPWRVVVSVSEARLLSSLSGTSRWLPWVAVFGLGVAGLAVGFLLLRLLAGRAGLIASRAELASAMAALAERGQMLNGVIENSTALIYVKHLDGRYLLYNQPFADAFALAARAEQEGVDALEVLLGRDDHWLDPEFAETWKANDVLAMEGPQFIEEWWDHPVEGRQRYESIKFPLHDGTGTLYATCGISLDVTERVRVTEHLRRAEEHFRGAFENAPIGMALVELDGGWSRVNRALCDFTGRAEDELLSKRFKDIIHPDDVDADEHDMRRLGSGEISGYQRERRYVHADGRTIWGMASVSLVRDAAGEPLHFIGQVEDVTERKEVQRELAVARDQAVEGSRVKSEFLATMSHEIRTPLNGVIGMTELLLATELTPVQATYARNAASSGEALLDLINDVLDFSKIEAGKLELDCHEFDLRTSVQATGATLAAQADAKGLELIVHVHDDVPPAVSGDRGRLRQVLTNLVSNAVKFTQAGEVRVEVRAGPVKEERVELHFSVADTGIGIAESEIERLFESFAQADSSTTRRYGGTGLGLAISRRLVDLMGGSISAVSRPGAGSTFSFTVCLGVPTPSSRPALESVAAPTGAATVSASLPLLVAEDNAVNQLVIETMLIKRGYTVEIAANGLQALDRLATSGPFGAVFMDCQMPELDGYGATERFRASEAAGRRLPIVAMTANAMKGDRERCLQAGMDDYLTKPLRPDELDAILDRWLGTIAEPSDAAAEKLLDDARIHSLRHDYGEVAEQLVELFEQGTPPLILELRSAGTQADGEALRRTAHQLKGSCQSIGAAYMATVAEGIEGGSTAATDVDRLDATFEPTVAAIRSALAEARDVRPPTRPERR